MEKEMDQRIVQRLYELGVPILGNGALNGWRAIEMLRFQSFFCFGWSDEIRLALLDFVEECARISDFEYTI